MGRHPWGWAVAGLVGVVAALATVPFAAADEPAELRGGLKIDGSSTVYLITEAMAKAFKIHHPGVSISVGSSGTGGGFKKFAAGETDVSNASRAIKGPEIEACRKAGVEFLEFQVAWDGLTVVLHPENTWAKELSVEQLHRIWKEGSTVQRWSDVEPGWPDEPLRLYGPGADSGTFDFFTEAVNEKEKSSRTDYEASENDNVLVQGVAGNKYALGYFGLAFFEENKAKLQAAAIRAKGAATAVSPSTETVLNKTYKPLSRPLFIYVKVAALKRPEVREFVRFYLRRDDLVARAKYIPLTLRGQYEQQAKLDAALKALE